jgi:hypothetical protein
LFPFIGKDESSAASDKNKPAKTDGKTDTGAAPTTTASSTDKNGPDGTVNGGAKSHAEQNGKDSAVKENSGGVVKKNSDLKDSRKDDKKKEGKYSRRSLVIIGPYYMKYNWLY